MVRKIFAKNLKCSNIPVLLDRQLMTFELVLPLKRKSLGENFYQGDVDTWSQDDFSFDEDFNMIQDIPDQRVSINKGEKSKYSDSGVISGDYSDDPSFRRNVDHLDIDALSDGGFTDMAAYPGIRLPAVAERMTSDPLSVELESTLKHLNPAEVERRRKLMGRDFRYEKLS